RRRHTRFSRDWSSDVCSSDLGVRASLGGVLRDEGYEVDAVDSGEACLERVRRRPFDVIVLDIWLPGMDGLATLAKLRERNVPARSEERRVGKECRTRWAPSQ